MWPLGALSPLWALAAWATVAVAQMQVPEDMKSIPLRTHSLNTPYLDSDMTSRWFDFGGDAIIRTDKYIRLAADMPSQSGWVWSRIPLTATNWEIEFEFSISGKGNLHGDGFALWVAKDRAGAGPVFGSRDRFEGLGIFFDTYKNNRPGVVFPYVMGMMGDGKTTYDAANDGKANEIGGCSARGLRGSSVPSKAKLTYFQDRSLQLQLQYKTAGTWTDCFKVEADDNTPIKMPNTAYLGFTAHTGELSDNFDIVSVETRNLYSPVGPQSGRTGYKSSSKPGGNRASSTTLSSWGWFFFKVILFLGVCAGGYFGWVYYRTNRRYSRF